MKAALMIASHLRRTYPGPCDPGESQQTASDYGAGLRDAALMAIKDPVAFEDFLEEVRFEVEGQERRARA